MISRSHRSFSEAHSEKALGQLVARALSGVWRASLPRISDRGSQISDLKSQTSDFRSQISDEDLSAETLALITPLLYATGSAALGWWRIRKSELADSVAGAQLHDAYRRSRLNALIHEREIKHVLALLRAVGIEPILVKGWAIARHYPDHALRPYGDIDLCIRPDQFAQAETALKCLEAVDGHYVDLHDGFSKLTWHGQERTDGGMGRRGDGGMASDFRPLTSDLCSLTSDFWSLPSVLRNLRNLRIAPDRSDTSDSHWDDLFSRSQFVMLGETPVRVLSAEDHLRVLCLHLLRSGAWRPLWLCDIALAVESRGPGFDWARCLGADPLLADWVACTIGLAHQLLGAEVSCQTEKFAIRNSQFEIPRWLAPAVLRQWGRAKGPSETEMLLPTVVRNLGLPAVVFRELRARWDRPIVATFKLRAPLNNWPRAPYQLADMLWRGVNIPSQLTQMVRNGFRRVAAVEFSPVFEGRDVASKV